MKYSLSSLVLLASVCANGVLCAAQSSTKPEPFTPHYAPNYSLLAVGSAGTGALAYKRHPILAANAAQWTSFAFASYGGQHIANNCKIELAQKGILSKFGTAPNFGMPSHYARNAVGINAGISLASWFLHKKNHEHLASRLPLLSSIFQTGIGAGDLMGSCN
jgi:hypothetical protein